MEGYDDPGVTPRAMMELFRQVEALSGEWTYTLTLSILEIYNESIHDLLNNNPGKDKEKLDIRQTPDGNVVPGLTEVPVRAVWCRSQCGCIDRADDGRRCDVP